MYALGRRVYVRSLDTTATVIERNYSHTVPRRAQYVVEFSTGTDYLTGADDLRGADYCCDGCGAWRPGYPYATAPDGEYPDGLAFCFLCAGPPAARDADRLADAAMRGYAA